MSKKNDGTVVGFDSSFAKWFFVPLRFGDDTWRIFVDVLVCLDQAKLVIESLKTK